MSKIDGLDKLIRNENSITIQISFSEYWVDGYSYLRTKMWCGSNVAYSETGWGKDNNILKGDAKTVTLGSLSPGTFYVVNVVFQTKSSTSGSDWVDNSDVVTFRILTNGRTPKWSWSETNYDYFETVPYTGFQVHYSDDDELVYTDATADIVKRAYSTLTGANLPTSGVDTRVWNSLVRRISAIQTEWGVPEGRHLDNVRPTVFCTTRDPGYYYDYEKDKYIWLDGRAIKAYKFNAAVESVPVKVDWPWVKELGRKEIRRGDVCKASYFLALVDALNHWIGLNPIYLSTSPEYVFDWSSNPILRPSGPLVSSETLHTDHLFTPMGASSIAVEAIGRFNLADDFSLFVESGGIWFTSQFNFYNFGSSCLSELGTAEPLGGSSGSIKIPKMSVEIDKADSNQLTYQKRLAHPELDAVIVGIDPFHLDHDEKLHTADRQDLKINDSIQLEQHGFFGFVNNFTISRRDESEDYGIDEIIRIVSEIESMIVGAGSILDMSRQLSTSAKLNLLSQTGYAFALADNSKSIQFNDSIDVSVTNQVPLDFDGRIDLSADIDRFRLGVVYEIADAENRISVNAGTTVSTSKTLAIDSANVSVGIRAEGANTKDSMIDMEADTDVNMVFVDALLNGQKNTPISGTSDTSVKPLSEVVIKRQTYVESDTDLSIISESFAVFKQPRYVEGEANTSVQTKSEAVIKLPRDVESNAEVKQDSTSELYAIDMVKSRLVESTHRIIVGGTGEVTLSKGQREIDLDYSVDVTSTAVVEFTVPTQVFAEEKSVVSGSGILDIEESRQVDGGSVDISIGISSEVSTATVDLVLASEIDDTPATEFDDSFAIEIERKLTFTFKED